VFYAATKSGQLIVYNALFAALDIGPAGDPASGLPLKGGANLKGIQIVENYSFGGFKPDGYGRPETGDLGMTFRIASNGYASNDNIKLLRSAA
jgi:hypothetical protein